MADTNLAYAARQKAKPGLTAAKAKELSDADMELARKQFLAIYEDERELRDRLKADHEYVDGVHPDGKSKRWTTQEITDRKGRPTISIDAMSGPIAQVSNGLAESKPAADMMPIGGGADDEKAEVWEGLLRRIQTTPDADYAGAWAGDHLVKLGRGAWVVTARYPEYNGKPDDPANWEMELCREWIENQHGVWVGRATKPDGSDRLYAFILQPLTEDLFDDKYGEGEFKANKSVFAEMGLASETGMSAWQGPQTVTVATWYRVKTEKVTITGTGPDGQPVTRQVTLRRVCVSTITATKEYEYSELPIPFIPIVFGEARRSNIDGARDVKGMVRAMKDAQDLVNVWPSYIAETIAQAARQEVIAAAGQIHEGNKAFWDLTKRLPYRLYDPIENNGHFVSAPVIQNLEAPIQAMTIALQQAEGFVRKAAGSYDADSDQTRASLSKESGVARKERRQQSEMGNSDFARAYAFMILFEIKLLMAWAPHVYSAARVMRITGRDEKEMAAVTYFGQEHRGTAQQVAQQMPQENGTNPIEMVFDLSTGRYDVKARVTKNPLTQRQENVDLLTEVFPAMPPEMQAKALPVMFDEMEGTVMKRVAAALNPKEQQGPSVEEAKQAQQVMDEQARIIDELKRQLDNKSTESQSRERIAKMETEAKERIEIAKLLHEEKMKEFELQQSAAQLEFDAQQADLQRQHAATEGDHAAAREFALREPKPPPTNGAPT